MKTFFLAIVASRAALLRCPANGQETDPQEISMRWHLKLLTIYLCLISFGCQQQNSWEQMTVVPPAGTTPDETFEEIRTAALSRDWPRMYGCMTVEARRDQISQLVIDIVAQSNRAAHTERQLQRAKEYLRVAKKHNLTDKDYSSGPAPEGSLDAKRRFFSSPAAYVGNADEFVADAWNVMQREGTSLFESEAQLSDRKIIDDYAVAKVHNFFDRYSMPDYCYIHFKKVDDRWLVDMSPWWIPWGPPMREVK